MAKEEKVKAKLDFSLIGKIYELIKPHRKAFYISIIITFLASLAVPSS